MINISEITKFFFSNPVIVRASIYSAVLTLCPGLAPLRREQVKQLSVNEDLDKNASLFSIQIFKSWIRASFMNLSWFNSRGGGFTFQHKPVYLVNIIKR